MTSGFLPLLKAAAWAFSSHTWLALWYLSRGCEVELALRTAGGYRR